MIPRDESIDDATWADLVDDLLDEPEDDGVAEPEASESGEWHRAEGYDPDAIF